MISLVHEHNRTMNAHHAAKRARLSSTPTAPQPQLAGAPHSPVACLLHLLCIHNKQEHAAFKRQCRVRAWIPCRTPQAQRPGPRCWMAA